MAENWIQEMIEREALPKATRTETVADFCVRHGIDESTYYYQSRKEEHQRKSLKIALMSVKKRAPEVLEKLAEKAEGGDMKATDMYLKYVLELADRLDLTSDGKPLYLPSEILNKYDNTSSSSERDSREQQEI